MEKGLKKQASKAGKVRKEEYIFLPPDPPAKALPSIHKASVTTLGMYIT